MPQKLPSSPASVEEVLACVVEQTTLLSVEAVSLESALGRVLRERVIADEDQPRFDVAAMDGYAVHADETAEWVEVVGMRRAGDWQPQDLIRGQAMQVATGAALPCAGLRVIPKEEVERMGERIRILRRPIDTCIRVRGQNLRAGDELMAPGVRLNAGHLTLLANVGWVRPVVTRQPRILHLVTGNELVPPGQAPGPGQIRDTNSTLVAAFLLEWGLPLQSFRVGEDEAEARALLAPHLTSNQPPDLLLISGGASVGEHDFTRSLLEYYGFGVIIHRTAARPGRPLIFAVRKGTVAFGLPGNPLAHYVCLNLYVRAALQCMVGLEDGLAFREGILTEAWNPGRSPWETLCPAVWKLEGGKAQITLLSWQNSGDLTPLRLANAVARLPSGEQPLPAGSKVVFLPIHLL